MILVDTQHIVLISGGLRIYRTLQHIAYISWLRYRDCKRLRKVWEDASFIRVIPVYPGLGLKLGSRRGIATDLICGRGD